MSSYDDAIESTDEFSRLTEALAAASSAPAVIEEAKEAARGALAVKNDLIEKRDSGFLTALLVPGALRESKAPRETREIKEIEATAGSGIHRWYVYTICK